MDGAYAQMGSGKPDERIMLTILLLIALTTFIVGAMWPHYGKRIEKWVHHKLVPIEKWAEGLPKPLNFVMKGPFWSSRKVAQASSRKGRQARWRLGKKKRK